MHIQLDNHLKSYRMKKIILSILLLCGFVVQAHEYLTRTDVTYYSDSISKQDEYTKRKCVLDVYYPKDANNASTIIWIHGGSLTGGRTEIPEALKNTNNIIVGIDYRLSPKVKAPVYIEDAAAATAWVFNHIAEFGGNANSIFISGHSAGGYLALMLTLDTTYLAKYHIDPNKLAGVIPFSGQAITHFTIRKENGIKATQPLIDKYAPLYFVRKTTPPILLITGDREMELLGRYEESAYLARMFKLVGNDKVTLYELQGYDHNMTLPAFPLLLKFVRQIRR